MKIWILSRLRNELKFIIIIIIFPRVRKCSTMVGSWEKLCNATCMNNASHQNNGNFCKTPDGGIFDSISGARVGVSTTHTSVVCESKNFLQLAILITTYEGYADKVYCFVFPNRVLFSLFLLIWKYFLFSHEMGQWKWTTKIFPDRMQWRLFALN